ncbi:MAG: hypothetical protein ACYCO3_12785 [Mycobacteriales bacterium]
MTQAIAQRELRNDNARVARADLVALGAAGPHVCLGQFRADLDRIVDQRL